MYRKLLLFITLLPFAAVGQYHITGRVVDIATKEPVAGASVFLSNASAGTETNSNGVFTINGVRGGQYNVVISIIGYATYTQSLLVNKDITLPDVDIVQQVIALKEVRIGPVPHWARDFEDFKREFLGSTDNARQCTILNPHVLDFDFDETRKIFTATASGFIEVENRALGYKIKYMLSEFNDDYGAGTIYFEGTAFFEDMKGTKGEMKKWLKKRQQTYLGSSMHFLRAVIANQVTEEKFRVERLIRKPNSKYTGGLNNKYIETIVTTPLVTGDYTRLTDQKGEYALEFKDCLCVIYDKNSLATSIVNINAPYAYFDNNGILLNPQDVIMQGSWGDSRLADMLPVDYEPVTK
ncbi:carboxypeptidase-like regulatory domain-containing protein [Mucilaginibacter sp. X5P1]|uniref:carboxypeptidase-like regulatory domain-containing protein n=1 Tax=Mucilaginibacter sp. X5P1 TaxID=2723088 RepID=UPI0016182A91|nr:carboxypeptidase-like regulatory domain-containing protein [Mucilaginibacter sp. X5P1]MBB6137153.1 hypothetical protein [Mucilaginibacter sp. X5P1]